MALDDGGGALTQYGEVLPYTHKRVLATVYDQAGTSNWFFDVLHFDMFRLLGGVGQ